MSVNDLYTPMVIICCLIFLDYNNTFSITYFCSNGTILVTASTTLDSGTDLVNGADRAISPSVRKHE